MACAGHAGRLPGPGAVLCGPTLAREPPPALALHPPETERGAAPSQGGTSVQK